MGERDSSLKSAELDADLLSAVVRVGILAVLAATVALSGAEHGMHRGAVADVGLYGVATALSLGLALRRIYHPVLPYAFATFDVVLVVAHMQIMASVMGLGQTLYALPSSLLIFVILIHASMRYQPMLIAYIATIFIVSVTVASLVPAPPMAEGMARRMAAMAASGQRPIGQVITFDLMPPILVATAGAILVLGNRRTRNLLVSSIEHATRTARLSRFFSPSVAGRLAETEDDDLVSGRRQAVAVLFIDIKGFTPMAERMPPDALGALLAEFRGRVTDCVFRHGGIVDKFIGDAVLVVFGAPADRDDDARRAIRCGMDVLLDVARWSEELDRDGRPRIEIGIGGHYGDVFIGIVGSGRLLEYTVIGDTVNVAERLERLSRETRSPFVVSRALLDQAGDPEGLIVRSVLEGQSLRGRIAPVDAVVLEVDTASPREAATARA